MKKKKKKSPDVEESIAPSKDKEEVNVATQVDRLGIFLKSTVTRSCWWTRYGG